MQRFDLINLSIYIVSMRDNDKEGGRERIIYKKKGFIKNGLVRRGEVELGI